MTLGERLAIRDALDQIDDHPQPETTARPGKQSETAAKAGEGSQSRLL